MATPTTNAHTLLVNKPNPPINNIHHFLPHKLTTTNYLLRKYLFMPILRGSDLLPAENNEEPKINLAFFNWKRQDQLLLSKIISTVTGGVHAQILGLTTSQEV
ncbi:hypothetical protein AMTR_s00046p00071430 [Amborella trichopoda]|uniref:Uncharacterized protein n=1 Tax=Amborella trichopoda TaxID=13333 RepID=U5D944_AMBTC|nr:hypothetical protein AMTR_s00046p00071430 [Amborella trichopoda]